MKFEVRRGKRGESNKFMCYIGGVLCLGANTLPTLTARILKELELTFAPVAKPPSMRKADK